MCRRGRPRSTGPIIGAGWAAEKRAQERAGVCGGGVCASAAPGRQGGQAVGAWAGGKEAVRPALASGRPGRVPARPARRAVGSGSGIGAGGRSSRLIRARRQSWRSPALMAIPAPTGSSWENERQKFCVLLRSRPSIILMTGAATFFDRSPAWAASVFPSPKRC